MINGGYPETPDNWIERNPIDEFYPIEEDETEEQEGNPQEYGDN